MKVLGLNHGEINSSAAIIIDGRVVAGALEERFNRQKRTKAFPAQASRFCLDWAGLRLADCDFVAQGWNPGASWYRFDSLYSPVRIRRQDNFYTLMDHLYNLTPREDSDWVQMALPEGSSIPPVYHIKHHLCHASNAFFLSPFEEAAIATSDFRGEYECMTLSRGTGKKIEGLTRQQVPDSLGMFYAAFTELLGYKPDRDEWKVMALSAFDIDSTEYANRIRKTVRILDGGRFELDTSCYIGARTDRLHLYSPKLVDLLDGRVGAAGAEPDEWCLKVARAMQTVTEEIVFHMLDHLYQVVIPLRQAAW